MYCNERFAACSTSRLRLCEAIKIWFVYRRADLVVWGAMSLLTLGFAGVSGFGLFYSQSPGYANRYASNVVSLSSPEWVRWADCAVRALGWADSLHGHLSLAGGRHVFWGDWLKRPEVVRSCGSPNSRKTTLPLSPGYKGSGGASIRYMR